MSGTTPQRHTHRYAQLVADVEGGDDARPPLVLLHGLSFDRTSWRSVLDALDVVDPGRRVIAFDLPGHGASPPSASYDLELVAEAVHDAVGAAGLRPPVIVGHSISAVISTIYASRYPTAGVVAVDSTIRVGPFAELLRSLDGELRGPGFPAVWGTFEASMHTELLPPEAQALARPARPLDQALFLGYQREVLEVATAELEDRVRSVVAALRDAGIPYALVAGDSVSEDDRRWLLESLPQTTIEVWPGTGHFPHLAHPRRFAERLAATSDWSSGDRHGPHPASSPLR
jgi:pimeloyl-ACP methyl ester carboxylesterase